MSATGPGSEMVSDPRFPGVMIHRTSVVDDGAKIGPKTTIWHFCHVLPGTAIGEGGSIGQNCMIGPNVTIGRGAKIQNNVSLYEGVTLGDDVFCGPSCVFTNVYNPRAHVSRKSEFRQTRVGHGVTIGANATVVCGYDIGDYAFIGAGAVVTRAVPAYALVVGNPARQIGWMSKAGERLADDLVCRRTGERYAVDAHGHLAPLL